MRGVESLLEQRSPVALALVHERGLVVEVRVQQGGADSDHVRDGAHLERLRTALAAELPGGFDEAGRLVLRA